MSIDVEKTILIPPSYLNEKELMNYTFILLKIEKKKFLYIAY